MNFVCFVLLLVMVLKGNLKFGNLFFVKLVLEFRELGFSFLSIMFNDVVLIW